MDLERILIICAGAAAMIILLQLRHGLYPATQRWKLLVIGVFLTIVGVLGTILMYFIEFGHLGGTSFFGAVLFVPVLMLPMLILRIPFLTLMDLAAPAGCAMLAVMRIDCLMSGCCIGKYLPQLGFQFPSQIVEMIVAVIIMVILLYLERKGGHKGKIYPYFLILYGATRFVLNWFRYGLTPFVLMLPNGNFWSIIAIIFGVLWLLVLSQSHKRKA